MRTDARVSTVALLAALLLHTALVVVLPLWREAPLEKLPVKRYVVRLQQPAPTRTPAATPALPAVQPVPDPSPPVVMPQPLQAQPLPVPVSPPPPTRTPDLPRPQVISKQVEVTPPLQARKPTPPERRPAVVRRQPVAKPPVVAPPPAAKTPPPLAAPPPSSPQPPAAVAPLQTPSAPVASPSQEANLTPPAPPQAAPAQQQVRSEAQAGPVAADVLQAYLAQVFAALERQKRFPTLARRRGMTGWVVLQFVILADGQIVDAKIVQSAGHETFQKAALAALQQASPLPAFPADLRRPKLLVEVPISYELTGRR